MDNNSVSLLEDFNLKKFVKITKKNVKEKWNECAYCGDKCAKLTIDHVKPKSKGGTDEPNNWVPACLSCNGDKASFDLIDWYPKQSFYCPDRMYRIFLHLLDPYGCLYRRI